MDELEHLWSNLFPLYAAYVASCTVCPFNICAKLIHDEHVSWPKRIYINEYGVLIPIMVPCVHG